MCTHGETVQIFGLIGVFWNVQHGLMISHGSTDYQLLFIGPEVRLEGFGVVRRIVWSADLSAHS